MTQMATTEPAPILAPRGALLRMAGFLAAAMLVVLVLHRQSGFAFLANPGLNGLILGVIGWGILSSFRRVARLGPEVAWAQAALSGDISAQSPPRILAPLARLLGRTPFSAPVTPGSLSAALETIATKLDESRELVRYLTGLSIFLGLLGTFWGLVATIGLFGEIIGTMRPSADSASLFEDLKSGLAAPLSAMSLAFASSLFGFTGSLVLGFLDLQVRAAEDRFAGEVEEAMTSAAAATCSPFAGLEGLPADLRASLEKIAAIADHSHARATMVAVADLADGVQKLVGQMRSEQQLIREWVEAQAEQSRDIKATLDRLVEPTKEAAE
jgi:hypothetical protein